MKIVIPLAGPDVVHPRYGVRALHDVGGKPLLVAALESRPWMLGGDVTAADLIFVVREGDGHDALTNFIEARYAGARRITLSHLTGGALYSALAGCALAAPREPFGVDLVDIIYRCNDWAAKASTIAEGGLVPVFESDDPSYSYLRRENGEVVEAAEKRVISREASSGTYFFRDASLFMTAAVHSQRNVECLAHKGALFICPMMNGVIAEGLRVSTLRASEVLPVGKLFH